MSIKFECSDCSKELRVKEEYAGRKVRCPDCDTVNQVPAADGELNDDDNVGRKQTASKSSRSQKSQGSQSRRSRSHSDDGLEDLPQFSKPKKMTSKMSKPDSGGAVTLGLIIGGVSLVGVMVIGAIVFIVTRPARQSPNGEIAAGAGANPGKAIEKPSVVQAQVDGNGANFRVKWEMPLNWTSEGDIERNKWPWATMKGQGQTIKLSTNRSIVGGVESKTSAGGSIEQLKTSHALRGGKLQAENTDWVDGSLNIHNGKWGPVVWSDYEYKGLVGKGYGIRCTVNGTVSPYTLMLECSQSARDKWRPTLLAISESVHVVKINSKGEEESDHFHGGFGDQMPDADPNPGDGNAQPNQ